MSGVFLARISASIEPCRVRPLVHLAEFRDRDVGVDLRGGQAGVAEHRLDVADVGPSVGGSQNRYQIVSEGGTG